MIADGEEFELGGTRFRMLHVSTSYFKLIPIDDPVWLLRLCEVIAPREVTDD